MEIAGGFFMAWDMATTLRRHQRIQDEALALRIAIRRRAERHAT